jgi:hypothetical protein
MLHKARYDPVTLPHEGQVPKQLGVANGLGVSTVILN